MSADVLLRTARRSQGLSQRALASASRDHQPTISALENGEHDPGVAHLERLLAATGHRLAVLPTTSRPVSEAATRIEAALRAGDERLAFREAIQVSDDLGREHGAIRVALTAAPPTRVGDPRFDALIAAIAEHYLRAERLTKPDWLLRNDRALRQRWYVDDLPAARKRALATTPPSFLRRGVVIAASELASV
jgi:transcriptional regulator with XRE-family HTH domain